MGPKRLEVPNGEERARLSAHKVTLQRIKDGDTTAIPKKYQGLGTRKLDKIQQSLEEEKNTLKLPAIYERAVDEKLSASGIAMVSASAERIITPDDLFFDNAVIPLAYPPPKIPEDYPERQLFEKVFGYLSAYNFHLEGVHTAETCKVRIPDFEDDGSGGKVTWQEIDVTYNAIMREDVDILVRHRADVAYESLLRRRAGLPELEVLPKDASKEVVKDIPAVRRVCTRARLAKPTKQNEAETRRPWDALFELSMNKFPASDRDVQDGFETCYGRERTMYFPLNALFEAVHIPELKNDEMTGPLIAAWESRLGQSGSILLHSSASCDALLNSDGSEEQDWLCECVNDAKNAIASRANEVKRDLGIWKGHVKAPFMELDSRAINTFQKFRCDGVAFLNERHYWHGKALQGNIHHIEKFRMIRGETASESATAAKSEAGTKGLPIADQARRMAEAQDHYRLPTSESEPGSQTDRSVLAPENLQIIVIAREDKKFDQKQLSQVFNQARYSIFSGARYLAQFGVYDVPVFAVATIGYTGYLLFGWGRKINATARTKPKAGEGLKAGSESKKSLDLPPMRGSKKGKRNEGSIESYKVPNEPIIDVDVYIADTNCPKFNICDEPAAIRFLTFLNQLRDVHSLELHRNLRDKQAAFLEEWQGSKARSSKYPRRFDWYVEGQLQTPAMQKVKQDFDAQKEKLRELDEQIEIIGAIKSLVNVPKQEDA
ncbi:hypothetical protein GGG16DRAFT_118954 [Schizophyllum commune]